MDSKSILLVCDSGSIHADILEKELKNKKASYFRLNTDALLKDVFISAEINKEGIKGAVRNHSCILRFDDIKSIWWFGVEAPLIAKSFSDSDSRMWTEQETKAGLVSILSSLDCYYLNHPNKVHSASVKVNQMLVAKSFGFNIPETCISSSPDEVQEFYAKVSSMIFKTFSHPTIKVNEEELVVYTSRVKEDDLKDQESIKKSLCFFQKEIKKEIEIRATVVGDLVFSAEIHSQRSAGTSVDWRRYDIKNTPHYPHELPEHIVKQCIQITKYYSLDFNTIDLILDPLGNYWFLEMNPNGLWAWIEILTGLAISGKIADKLIDCY